MFSVSSDSLPGVFMLAIVANSGQDGVSASVVRAELEEGVSSVVVRDQTVGDVLRALERQGFVEQRGVRFVATESGCERVETVVGDMLRVDSTEEYERARREVWSECR